MKNIITSIIISFLIISCSSHGNDLVSPQTTATEQLNYTINVKLITVQDTGAIKLYSVKVYGNVTNNSTEDIHNIIPVAFIYITAFDYYYDRPYEYKFGAMGKFNNDTTKILDSTRTIKANETLKYLEITNVFMLPYYAEGIFYKVFFIQDNVKLNTQNIYHEKRLLIHNPK